ncbi:tape measure protein [Sphingobium sp. Z007]|uniref:tape measure protein n=1 Tax=Sphingobium sp. Z007 TaxID=627495 RepID=UPI000B49FA78|nr:tape measure protein [Sphingobium sp. Z007]
MSDTTIRITIDATGAQRGGSQAERALDRVGNSSRRLNGALGSTTIGITTFSRSLAGIKGAGAAAILAGITAKFTEMADASANMEAKLRLATRGFADYGQAQEDVRRIAAATRSELTSTATLYGKLMTSGKGLDASQQQIARATETVTKSLKISGATAGETASTVLQLGQALSSGKLNGDEFRSLAENSPRLMKLLADSMNVPVGALKKMASEGQLTADKLFRAFTDTRFTAALDEEFKQMPKTFGDAFTAMTNLATVTFGAFDKGGGFSQALYNFADQGSGNMKSIADAAYNVGAEIRDTFAGLSDAFQPLFNGAMAVFDAIGFKAQTLRDQVAGILGALDQAANAANRGSDAGGDVLDAILPQSVYDKTKDPTYGLQSNMRGRFERGYAQSRRDRARTKLERAYRERTGDDVPKGWNDQKLTDESRKLGPPPPKKSGGSGNLRPATGTATAPKGAGKKSDAQREAERAAKEAERQQKAAQEFWAIMEENRKIAALMPIEAEKYTAQMDLQRVSGKELTATEKERLSTLMDQTRAAKLLTDMRVANDNGKAELDFQKRKLTMTDKEAAMAEAAWEFESRALEDKVDITGDLYQQQLAMIKARAGETFEIERQNRMLKDRESLLSQYSAFESDRLKMEQFDADRKRLDVLRSKPVADGGITEEQYRRAIDGLDRAVAETATRFEYELGQSIDQLGEQFSGTFGKAISKFGQLLSGLANAAKGDFAGLGPLGSIIDLLGKNGDGSLTGIGQAAAKASQNTLDSLLGRNGQKSALLSPLKSLNSGFDGFKGDMKKIFTGKGPGSVAGAIGNTLGAAASGVQMGQMADGLMKTLGINSSKTGASIGGGIGSIVGGPIGGLIGSIGGGLIGGMFKKKRYGTANITLGDDGYLDSSVTGNKAAYEAAAGTAAGAVMDSIGAIADQLGGSITGNPNISIGQYKGKWRVSTTGRTGKLKGGSGRSDIVDFGKEGEEAAIEFAIKTALQKGVLTGISDFSKRVLGAAQDLDRAVTLATKYENIVKELARIDDPIGAPLAELNNEFRKLREEMIANSATAAELANVDRYYMIQRENMLKDQLSDLKSFREKLMGEGSGLSTKSRLDSKLAEFANYENALASGKSVDTSAMTTLGSDIWDMTKDIYGTATAQSQNIRNRLLDATDSATKYAENIYAHNSTGVVEAVDSQTQLIAEQLKQQQIGNSLTQQLLEAIERGQNITALWNGSAVNGKQAGTV